MVKTLRKITAWLITGPEPFMATCRRCGKTEPKPELPLDMDAFITYMHYIGERHRHCDAKVLTDGSRP